MDNINSILFVCTGNSCRSPMAEGIMRKRLYEIGRGDIDVSSAGIITVDGMAPSKEAVDVMKEDGVDISFHQTRNINKDIIRRSGLILVMEPIHKAAIAELVPEAISKTFLLKEYKSLSKINPRGFSVQDPIGKTIDYYRSVRDDIKYEIDRILSDLRFPKG